MYIHKKVPDSIHINITIHYKCIFNCIYIFLQTYNNATSWRTQEKIQDRKTPVILIF